jgi:hypothetical protein
VDYQEAFSKTTFGLSMTRNFRNPICTWMSFDFNAKNGWDFRYRGTAIIGRHNLEMLAQEAYRRICDLESRKLPCVVSAIGVNLRPKNYQNALS